MLIRARTLVPVGANPIDNGALWIEAGRIQAVGHWPEIERIGRGPVLDLGASIIHPGWVNAHCHLDLTDLAGHITPPRSFADWIKALLGAKGGWSYSEFAASWLRGAQQLIRSGTTTVANIESVPEMLPDVRAGTPLRVWSLLELTGVRRQRDPADLVTHAVELLESLPHTPGGVGLSPHAPYSTPPRLLSLATAAARQHGWLVATHIAESAEEFDMFVHRSGALHDWLAPQRSMEDCGLGSPLAHCARHDLLHPDLLVIHANTLTRDDMDLLVRSGASVVHCPQSHDYFQHPRFRFAELRAAGVRVCLGTDSLASVRKLGRKYHRLSMTDELRAFCGEPRGLSPRELIQLATLHGAHALRLHNLAGELRADAWADLAVIPYEGSTPEAEAAVLAHSGDVAGTMIDGNWAWLSQELSNCIPTAG